MKTNASSNEFDRPDPTGVAPANAIYPSSSPHRIADKLRGMVSQRENRILRLVQLFKNHKVIVYGVLCDTVSFSPLNGDGENQAICLSWMEKGREFKVLITEDGLAYSSVESDSLDIEDDEGSPCNIEFIEQDGKPVKLSEMPNLNR